MKMKPVAGFVNMQSRCRGVLAAHYNTGPAWARVFEVGICRLAVCEHGNVSIDERDSKVMIFRNQNVLEVVNVF